jgi:hypothetical protein
MNVHKTRLFWPRYPALLACFLSLVITAAPTYAGELINSNSNGAAINGYDPVAYFTMGEAVLGVKEYKHRWLDVNWNFISEEHRGLFAADPTRYAPQHGGYCSSGAIDGVQDYANPRAWRIVDNKLYLFYGKSTAARWNPDSPEVSAANEEWLKTLSNLIQ